MKGHIVKYGGSMRGHLTNHINHHELCNDSTLHVISMVSNSVRFHSRYRLFRKFMEEMENTPNVVFYVVEVAFGDRHFEITDACNPRHLQLRCHQEIWLKENALNLGVKHLFPKGWKYMAWVDGDIHFRNPGWALSSIHELQHYPIIQPWSECLDLGPHGEVMQVFHSFGSTHRRHIKKQRCHGEPYQYAHSGFAWACTRYFWENVGGLMDFPILGSADHHMAWSLIGDSGVSMHGLAHENYKRLIREWQKRACHVTHGDDVGYIPGVIEHSFHGPKHARRYRERWQILVENAFDPLTDLARDSQGLIQVVGKPKLIADIREYMHARNEDSTEK